MTDADKTTQLPDDHPLVTAYNTVKEKLAEAKKGQLSPEDLAELQKKANRLDELDTANKTEVQKLTDQVAALTTERDTLKSQVDENTAEKERAKTRTEVAKAKGVPESLLRGSSKEDYESHADELIAAGIKVKPAPSADGQGDVGKQVSEGDEKSADEIVDAVLKR